MDTLHPTTTLPETPVRPEQPPLPPLELVGRLLREHGMDFQRVEGNLFTIVSLALERRSLRFEEYVRLFNGPLAGRGVFVQYFWRVLAELDQCLTSVHAFFGDKLDGPIAQDAMLAYVERRRALGVTDRAIHQELATLDAAMCGAAEVKRKCCPLPSRKFLKRPGGALPPAPLPEVQPPCRPVETAPKIIRRIARAATRALTRHEASLPEPVREYLQQQIADAEALRGELFQEKAPSVTAPPSQVAREAKQQA